MTNFHTWSTVIPGHYLSESSRLWGQGQRRSGRACGVPCPCRRGGIYGAGLARHLSHAGVTVVAVDRPNRQHRHRRGKSDPADAEAAARAVLAGQATTIPKARSGIVEAIRVLRVARTSAIKARTQAANQLRDLLVTAPEELRAGLCSLSTAKRVAGWPPPTPGPVLTRPPPPVAPCGTWPAATRPSPPKSRPWTSTWPPPIRRGPLQQGSRAGPASLGRAPMIAKQFAHRSAGLPRVTPRRPAHRVDWGLAYASSLPPR
jgi:Transposase